MGRDAWKGKEMATFCVPSIKMKKKKNLEGVSPSHRGVPKPRGCPRAVGVSPSCRGERCRVLPRRVQCGERLLQPGGVRRAHGHPESHLGGAHSLQGHGHRQVRP